MKEVLTDFLNICSPAILTIRPSFHPSPFRAIQPSSSLWADWLGLQTLLAGPQVWLAGPQVWLAGCQALLAGPQAWLTGPQALLDSLEGGGPTNRWTKEHLPILQDFIPYPGCCPKKNTVLWFILLVQPRKKTALENEPKIDFMHQIQQKVFSWS